MTGTENIEHSFKLQNSGLLLITSLKGALDRFNNNNIVVTDY